MKKNKIIIGLSISCLAVVALAGTVTAQLDKLTKERNSLEHEMHKLRVELIKTDPELKLLHEKILAMHKELAIKIDNKPAMRKLVIKAAKLDAKIEEVKSQTKK